MLNNISRLDLLYDNFLIFLKTNFIITTNLKTYITSKTINNINSIIFLAEFIQYW